MSKKYLNKYPLVKNNIMGSAYGEDMVKILGQSKIALNIHDPSVPYGGNMRLFEIPATKSLQIADKCPKDWFKDGDEIVLYKNNYNLLKKVKYYLNNDQERIRISNNGYKIINLGIKITSQELIQSYKEHKPDFIGLSGLLVKSAQMMVETVEDLNQEQISVPILVGGAALTEKFTYLKIFPSYKNPAQAGLSFGSIVVRYWTLSNNYLSFTRSGQLPSSLSQHFRRPLFTA